MIMQQVSDKIFAAMEKAGLRVSVAEHREGA